MYFHVILAASLVVWRSQVYGGVVLRGAEDSDTCESEDCENAANHILKWLNPEADPCEDFYEFTCGNWRNLPVDEREEHSLGARGSLVEKYIPDLLEDPSKTNGNKNFEKLRDFMNACMDFDTIKSRGVTPVKQLIQKAGGWPVLDPDWSAEDWDFLTAEIALGGSLINVDLTDIFSARPLIKIGQSSQIDKFSPTHEELVEGLENESTKGYYDIMVAVAVALGADKGVAGKAMMDVLDFEKAFVGELQNKGYSYDKITFGEFQEAVQWLNLTKLLVGYFPESVKILPEENVFADKEYFLILDKFINQYPPETFANYMVYKGIYPLLDYIYLELEITIDVLYGSVKKDENSLFDFCSEYVSRTSLGPALAAYLGISYSDAGKTATELTKVIIEELSKEVGEIDWMDEGTRKETAKRISEIKIEVGFPPNITDLDRLDKLYKGYDIDTSNYFEAVMYDKKWRIQRQFDFLNKDRTSDDVVGQSWLYYVIRGLFPNLHFSKGGNIIEVSGPGLYFVPLFSPENPAYVNYGQVGFILAQEIFKAVDVKAAPEEVYAQKKQCFIDLYSKLKFNGNFSEEKDMAANEGLKLSLQAYRKLANQRSSPERKLPQLQQYSVDQLFMISVANFFCEIPNKEKPIKWYAPESPFDVMVKGMMMNSPDFSGIFNCDKNDPMNPPDKCEVL